MHIPPLPYQSKIVEFRHALHQFPEVSGNEHATAKRVESFLKQFEPDSILNNVGGTGLLVTFNGSETTEGPTVLFRAELDALPIEDAIDAPHRSGYKGVGHKCGHDGHMSILAGLAGLLQLKRPLRGRVLLLFQPAEETGAGALDVLQDTRFQGLAPDFVFALHNLPGIPHHQVVVRQNVFAAASSGMIIDLTGKSSHAGEPEKGLNPGMALAEIILEFNLIIQQTENFKELTFLTVIHARLGEVAFGTNPGFATVMATLRAFEPSDFEKLTLLTTTAATRIAEKHGVLISIRFVEAFPATVNHEEAVELVEAAASELHLTVTEAAVPFRWSEDFGHFTHRYKGALFGLGSGEAQPELHHSDYDFPDIIIPTGARLFYNIATKILNR